MPLRKQSSKYMAQTGKDGSWLQLLNPLSPFMGGGDRYPEFVAKMFPGSPQTAWLVSKAAATSLLAAAVAGGARAVEHFNRVADIAEMDSPARKMDKDLNTTFKTEMTGKSLSGGNAEGGNNGTKGTGKGRKGGTTKTAAEKPVQAVSWPSALTPSGIAFTSAAAGVPLLALALSAASAWRGVDHYANNRREGTLDKHIAEKDAIVKGLIRTRARLARGTASDREVTDALKRADTLDVLQDKQAAFQHLLKSASGDSMPLTRKVMGSAGLLIAALGVFSTVAGYKYFRATDESNIRYRAMRKGLQEYARMKSMDSPVYTVPKDSSEYFSGIDGNKQQSGSMARDSIEIEASRAPVAVTL